jgi:hypothetical protein
MHFQIGADLSSRAAGLPRYIDVIIIAFGLKPLDCIQKKFSEFIFVLFIGQKGGRLFFLDRKQRRIDGVKFGADQRITVAANADGARCCSWGSHDSGKTAFRGWKTCVVGIIRFGEEGESGSISDLHCWNGLILEAK